MEALFCVFGHIVLRAKTCAENARSVQARGAKIFTDGGVLAGQGVQVYVENCIYARIGQEGR